MQQGNFINVFLARHVSGTYAHDQEHWILCCTIWFSASNFWMGGGLDSRCVGRVYCADGAMHGNFRTTHTTHAAARKTTTHPKTWCRKPYAAKQHPMPVMMGVSETCRAKNTLIKLLCCIKLAFQVISLLLTVRNNALGILL